MSGHLIDTAAALCALGAPERLSRAARSAVMQGPNWLSVISYWEVAIKTAIGKLDVGDPRVWWADALDQLKATPLPLRASHVSEICGLPAVHNDPFDRALIAQAIAEGLRLVTTDATIKLYASARFQTTA